MRRSLLLAGTTFCRLRRVHVTSLVLTLLLLAGRAFATSHQITAQAVTAGGGQSSSASHVLWGCLSTEPGGSATSAGYRLTTGCGSIVLLQFPTVATVGGSQTICASGTTFGLGGDTPSVGTGAWSVVSGGTGSFNPSAAAPGATFTHGSGAGPVVLRWTISNAPAPPSTADVNVTVNPIPPSPTGGNDGPLCVGSNIHLTATTVAGASYSWTGPNSFTSSSQNPTIPAAPAAAAGIYSVSATVNGCTSPAGTTTVSLTSDGVQPLVTPPANITLTQAQCCGTFGGLTSATSATLATFLGAGSATDNCTPVPSLTRLTAQVGGFDVTGATCFPSGTTAVAFRYQDVEGNIGTATANVTVQMFGDLNLDNAINAVDMVILRAYLNGALPAGTPPFNAPVGSADVSHDSIVNPTDMVLLRAYLNHAINCLRN